MNKKLLTALVMVGLAASAQVKVGTNPTNVNNSAIFEMESTTKGLLLPRMSTLNRLAISSPVAGLQVFDTNTNTLWFHSGTAWINSTPAGGTSKWSNDAANTRVALTNLSDGTTARTAGTEFIVRDNGNVGIGATAPSAKLDVNGYIKVGTFDSTADAVLQPGLIRFNTTTSKFQGYVGGATPRWVDLN